MISASSGQRVTALIAADDRRPLRLRPPEAKAEMKSRSIHCSRVNSVIKVAGGLRRMGASQLSDTGIIHPIGGRPSCRPSVASAEHEPRKRVAATGVTDEATQMTDVDTDISQPADPSFPAVDRPDFGPVPPFSISSVGRHLAAVSLFSRFPRPPDDRCVAGTNHWPFH
jgi:hypothetical protein